MIRTRTLRIALCASLVSLGALAGGLGAGPASAATPKLIVTPRVNLRNGEVVHISGSGFTPGDEVFPVECLRSAKGESGCKVPNDILQTMKKITSTGLLPPSTFKVTTGKIGNGTCGTTKTNLAKCAVSVGNASGGDSAVGDIVFALPKKK